MAGRPRQPIKLLKAKGKKNLTKAEIKERMETELSAPVGDNIPPDYLNAKEKKEFIHYADQLIALEIFSDLDKETLATYVIAVNEWKKLTGVMRKLDPLEDIQDRRRVALERDRAFKQMMNSASKLGLNISSRCKLVVPKVEEPEENRFKKYVK